MARDHAEMDKQGRRAGSYILGWPMLNNSYSSPRGNCTSQISRGSFHFALGNVCEKREEGEVWEACAKVIPVTSLFSNMDSIAQTFSGIWWYWVRLRELLGANLIEEKTVGRYSKNDAYSGARAFHPSWVWWLWPHFKSWPVCTML